MSKKVIISADSTCDLSPELIDRYNIKTIPLIINLGDESFLDGQGFTPMDMYSRYRLDGTLPKTAAPGIADFHDFFSRFTREGYEVVHLDISSELSASCNNALIGADGLDGVYVLDSRMLSSGIGLLAIEGAECRDKGMCAADIAERLRALTEKVDVSFVLDTLEFMWKGGRCSGITALGANILKLKPALEMAQGKLGIYKKYRGSITAVYRKYISERLEGKDIYPGHIFITDSGEVSPDDLKELTDLIASLVPAAEIHHTTAGCTVSSHCGPKTLGVLFINK